jgi:hypothetical protein
MMRYVRETTLDAVDGLGVEELDYLHDPGSNSIGALLAHVAAVEGVVSVGDVLRARAGAARPGEWGAALDLGEAARREIRGRPLDAYVKRLGGRPRAHARGARGARRRLARGARPVLEGGAGEQLLQVVPRVRGRAEPQGTDPVAARAGAGFRRATY